MLSAVFRPRAIVVSSLLHLPRTGADDVAPREPHHTAAHRPGRGGCPSSQGRHPYSRYCGLSPPRLFASHFGVAAVVTVLTSLRVSAPHPATDHPARRLVLRGSSSREAPNGGERCAEGYGPAQRRAHGTAPGCSRSF